MKRLQTSERQNYTSKLESIGINYHTHDDGTPYWYEKAYYSFTEAEVLSLEAATNELQRLCIETVTDLIENKKDFSSFKIPKGYWPMIIESWSRDEVSIYGRFDLAYSPNGSIKMLEYNADTPTSLVEASIGQWHWLQDKDSNKDQFNSLHERLIAAWTRAKEFCPIGNLYFLSLDTYEDWQTTTYMRDVAEQAGWNTSQLNMLDLGWDSDRKLFVDLDCAPLHTAFKLYPWEHMFMEEFGKYLTWYPRPITFLEPAWKMLLSNKAILPELWKRYPGHANLLPAYFEESNFSGQEYVKKPIFGREGANVEVMAFNSTMKSEDQGYGEEGFIFQKKADLYSIPNGSSSITPILGSWVVDGESAGMGIRESDEYITNNRSRFVPHMIEG